MRIVKVPGRNGLGKTDGAEKFCEVLAVNLNTEELDLDLNNVEQQQKEIYSKGKEVFESGEKGVFLGGDHSISYPLTKAFFESFEGKLIVFDAHVDLMPAMKEPSHEEWLRALLEIVDSKKVMIIGAREIDAKEEEYLAGKNIEIVGVSEVREDIESVKKKIEEFCAGEKLYVSFDMDVFDASIVKATGYPVAGGLSEEEGIELVRFIGERNLQGFDIVELHSGKEGFESELKIASRVLEEVL
tara:strand:- start:19 stop:747 length:729 start_codon:yes stop_codon:yes gene_type:complete